MTQAVIFQPMMALIAWTFAVLLLMPFHVFRAARRKMIALDDLKMGVASNALSRAGIVNRNYMNLLELPILFYVACLTSYATSHVDSTVLFLAWTYVALRIAHSLVHLSYNKVLHRGALFGASNFVLILIWIRLSLGLFHRAGT